MIKYLLFLIPTFICAQAIQVDRVTADPPGGTCNARANLRWNQMNDKFWGCDGTSWKVIGTGGVTPGSVTSVDFSTNMGTVTGNPITSSGTITNTVSSADVIGLFSACSGTQYLGADGSCHSSSSGGVSGASFISSNNHQSTSASWQNFSIMARIAGEGLQAYPTSWKVRLLFTAGSPVIGGMKILRTLSRSTSVIDSTTVTIGGMSAPTLTTPAEINTDAISLALDETHDYWFVIFFTNTGANASVSVGDQGPMNTTSGYTGGDQTGVSTIPSLTLGGNAPFLFVTATY